MQAFAVHDRVRGVRTHGAGGVRNDPRRAARPGPEHPEVIRTQRPVSPVALKHPLPGYILNEAMQQLPRRLGKQNVPRSRLRVNQGQVVGLEFASAQAANLPRPASGQQDQPHRCNTDRVVPFALTQDSAEPRQIVCTEQPPARPTTVADDALARVTGGFGAMAPRNGAVEHVA